jgi:hypothetical protein
LRDRARQREVGVHQHLGAGGGRLEPERRGGLGRAATLGIVPLRLHPRGVIDVVDLFELDEAGEGQRDGAEPHCDVALIGLVVDHFGELRAGHAGRDALNIH